MSTWKITLEYDGTRYRGWQEQNNARTVAGELRRAAEDFFSNQVEILGAGRTDAGVHALGQVARLRASGHAGSSGLLRALNDRLPPDINILKVEGARERFDPRKDALARYYLYQISTRRTAFAKKYAWWVRDNLDLSRMARASSIIAGRHDFAHFCERRGDERSTVVVVSHAEMARVEDLVLLRIVASHFLWKMVRRIAGALVEVGRGALAIEEFERLLDSRSARPGAFDVAPHTAPPAGLFLERVVYDKSEGTAELKPAFPVASFK